MHELWDQITTVIRSVWSNKKYIPLMGWLIAPAAWLYIINMPDQYQAQAQVYVDTQSLLKPLLEGLTVETDPDTKIRLIAKTLKTRPILEQVIQDSDLSLYVKNEKDFERYYQLLENKLQLQSAKKENLFNLSFQFHNPNVAKKVLESVINIFVERTLGESRTEGDTARRFLESQIQDYEKRLNNADLQLTEFKRKYSGLLPEDGGNFQSQLNQQRQMLNDAELELQQLFTRLSAANKQLAGEPKYLISAAPAESIVTQYDSRLEQQQTLLDELSLKYTDNHPDIIELKRKIEEMNKLQAAERARLSSEAVPGTTQEINPLYQELKLIVSQLTNDIASQKVKVENIKQKLADLEQKKYQMPQVEAELLALTRGYNITKQKYEELLVRRDTAELAHQADRSAEEIQFKIIDPPRVPPYPIGPKRLLLIVGSTFAALAAGIGLAFLLSQINPVVSNSKELAQLAGVPVFGVISVAPKIKKLQQKKPGSFWFLFWLILLLCAFAIVISGQLFPQVGKLLQAFNFTGK